jgi:uncharacterized coiled-coil protein SlyX
MDKLEARMDNLEARIDGMDERLIRVEANQAEQKDFLTALLHNQEAANAKLESLELSTPRLAVVQKIQNEVNTLGGKIYDLANLQECK